MPSTFLHLPFPPSVNGLYMNVHGRGRVKTPPYRDWLKEAGWMLNQQRPGRFKGPVKISLSVTAPDKRKRDLDNLFKPVLDLLKHHKIIVDDNSEFVRRLSAEWLESGDPCTVTIEEAA